MQIFILSFVVIAIAIAGMAVGVIFSNRAIKGSCGGIGNIPGMQGHECRCSNPCEKRKRRLAEAAAATATAQREEHIIRRF